MRTAKDFLVSECSNLKGVLEETLRFKYGLEGSQEFFEECQARLTFLADEISKTDESDLPALQKNSFLLNQLSNLISRIERSSISEYSWPFVEELKRIATATCTEPTLIDPKTPPHIYVLSDGGLDKYGIIPEQNRPSGARKRIHTIIFPRTLKHFVLLHAILGHELGHAMWRCSEHQNTIRNIVTKQLFATGVFANASATAGWLYAPNAPTEVKAQLARLPGVTAANFFQRVASWDAWIEEIVCDFVGLITFGPSFVAAECNLLYSMNCDGAGLGPMHPPVGCRVNYLLSAANLRGYDATNFSVESLRNSATTFWAALNAKKQPNTWFDVFTSAQLNQTCDALSNLMNGLPPALYPIPSEADLALLGSQLARAIPPVGFELDENKAVSCRKIDFRHVLYAGWIASTTPPEDVSFAQINRLCEHGMMQQRAIDMPERK
jgi:hypothetical protein